MQTETRSPDGSHASPALFILLGASNLARASYGLMNCLTRCLSPRPVEFLHALGPGRAYITEGGILSAVYPPILNCGILNVAKDKSKSKRMIVALVTDIGNDIMYGVSAEKIILGLKTLFNTMEEIGASVLTTTIPVDLEQDVGKFYFLILRRIFFRKSRVEYHEAASAVRTINQFIKESENEKITVLKEMGPFCGVDKIHYRLSTSHRAWSYVAEEMLRRLNTPTPVRIGPADMAGSLACNLARILCTDMFGITKKPDEAF